MDRLPLLAVCADEIAAHCHLPVCNVRLGVSCPSTNSPYAASRPHSPSNRHQPGSPKSIADELLHDLRIHQCELPMEKRQAGRAAVQLRLSDGWANLILDTVPEAMLVVDQHGMIFRANAGAHTVFGYPEGALPGLAVEDLMPEPLRTGHVSHRALLFANPGLRPMGEGRELLGRRADGSVFPAEIGIGTMRMDTQTFAVVSIVDISRRRRAEDELRIAAIAFESQ